MQYIFDWLYTMYSTLIAAGKTLETGEVMLLGETIAADGETAVGDLVAPTFTGYANGAIAAWIRAVDVDLLPYLAHAPFVFSPTNGANLPQYIYGAAILDANGDLVCVDIFDAPLLLSNAGQQLHVTVKVKIVDNQPAIRLEAYVE